MRLALPLLLTSALAAAPSARILSATLLKGPGRELPTGAAPFHPRLTVDVALEGVPDREVPKFRLWAQASARSGSSKTGVAHRRVRLVMESVARLRPGQYRILAVPAGGGEQADQLVLEIRIPGHRPLRLTGPIQVRLLPASGRPAPAQDARD